MLQLLEATYNILALVSIGVLRNAQRSILRNKISAHVKIYVPPVTEIFAGPRHPKMVLPYSSVDTAIA